MKNDKPRASFVFWQEYPEDPAVPVFNIFGNHKASGSSVTIPTLIAYGIKIPAFPSFFQWKLGELRRGLNNAKPYRAA